MSTRTLTLTSALLTLALAAPALAAETGQNPKGECESREKAQMEQSASDKIKQGTDSASATKAGKDAMSGGQGDRNTADAGTKKDAKEANEEIVENSKKSADGSEVAATGPAKPEENWFGCPPDEDKKPS